MRVKEEVEEVEEEADASDLLSLSSWPRSTSTLAVASSFLLVLLVLFLFAL